KNNPEENTASDIQKSLHINKGYVSQIVKGLSEKGYLTVTADENDHRYMHYTVTDKTHDITDAHQKIWDTLGTRVFKGISPEDREIFDRVTITICKNIDEMTNEKPAIILDR
ncbi:MAG: MarR family winged helix-turn-helix transcriptional regulator, partial [Lachnospiraceae bacterium]|nr:MarR family winged helix-turn-helix transcriptional regulator [Lachnospiraceae bacterium]